MTTIEVRYGSIVIYINEAYSSTLNYTFFPMTSKYEIEVKRLAIGMCLIRTYSELNALTTFSAGIPNATKTQRDALKADPLLHYLFETPVRNTTSGSFLVFMEASYTGSWTCISTSQIIHRCPDPFPLLARHPWSSSTERSTTEMLSPYCTHAMHCSLNHV